MSKRSTVMQQRNWTILYINHSLGYIFLLFRFSHKFYMNSIVILIKKLTNEKYNWHNYCLANKCTLIWRIRSCYLLKTCSESRCGADRRTFEVCASSTSLTIWERVVSVPTWVALISREPFWLMEPAITALPSFFVTGMASPTRDTSWSL